MCRSRKIFSTVQRTSRDNGKYKTHTDEVHSLLLHRYTLPLSALLFSIFKKSGLV